jgi:parvulin-like peptidyl-prolyl isomerase
MKTIIMLVLILLTGFAAQAQENPAIAVAQKIAQKLKDTLSLSSSQQDQLYHINMQLHNSKMSIRQQYGGSDSLGLYLQRVENTRDSLYRRVLQEEKYLLYKQKKSTIISSH